MATKTAIERLMALVDTSGECWLWRGRLDRQGYGRFGRNGAHRAAYERLVGPIPEGLEVDHLCRTPRCVNPAHLEPVTREENSRRRSEAITHCKSGHPFDERNTYRGTSRTTGRKRCRACNRASVAAYRARRIGAVA